MKESFQNRASFLRRFGWGKFQKIRKKMGKNSEKYEEKSGKCGEKFETNYRNLCHFERLAIEVHHRHFSVDIFRSVIAKKTSERYLKREQHYFITNLFRHNAPAVTFLIPCKSKQSEH
jgi:hypothetical protein